MNIRANIAASSALKIGLIINPVAGLGGPLGLKGTDGDIAARALAAGAAPRAGERALIALKALAPLRERLTILTGPGEMGERVVREAGFQSVVPDGSGHATATSAADTTRLAARMAPEAALLMFAGGDGTAHDVMRAIGEATPALGVPAGVKMHSGVFATTPQTAGQAALNFLTLPPERRETEPGEVLDRAADPAGGYSMVFHGVLQTPRSGALTQNPKAMAAVGDEAALDGACARAAEMTVDGRLTIVGPGSTMRRVKRRLGDEGALLGVDVYRNGELAAGDVGEADLLNLAREPARIIVSPIGGQGFLFGRGNQQISAEVIRRVGVDNIVIVASEEKLVALGGQPLITDTGDAALDAMLAGYRQILTGRNRKTVFRIGHAQTEGGVA